MNEKYLIGIDSGTQSTRVIIFNTKGEQVCKGIGKHPPLIIEKKGWQSMAKWMFGSGFATRRGMLFPISRVIQKTL